MKIIDIHSRCYLCHSDKDLTEEHVIPKVIFKPFKQEKYVKLMACDRCNKSKGKDDEYIARFLQATSHTSEAREAFQNCLRGARKGRKGILYDIEGRAEKYTSSLKVKIPYAKQPNIITHDKVRVENFFSNLSKGLQVYHSNQFYDWDMYKAHIDINQLLINDPRKEISSFTRLIAESTISAEWKNIISYKGGFVEKNIGSFWEIEIYKSHIARICISKNMK